MISAKQIQANRRNALKSTGPRTPAGKAMSRLNALRHGLTAEVPALPGEDPAALAELREEILAELKPVGVMEVLIVERIWITIWKLRRLNAVETGVYALDYYGHLQCSLQFPKSRRHSGVRSLLTLKRHPNAPSDVVPTKLLTRHVMV
jgi:hypothetical protein